MTATLVTDWVELIDELTRRGLSRRQIGDAMLTQLTDRMVNHYRAGVVPLHYRGEALIALWCRVTGSARESLPLVELTRGHRAEHREPVSGPTVSDLPQWPPCAPVSVAPVRRGPGRPRKAVAV